MGGRWAVIVVTWNSAAHIGLCLEALAAQTRTGFDVLVVDNASTDDSAAIALSHGAHVIRMAANTGFAAACNAGVTAAADAHWIVLLNPDAFAAPDWFDRLCAGVARWPVVEAFGCTQLMAADPSRLDGMGDSMHWTGIPFRGGFGRADAPVEGTAFAPCGAMSVWSRQRYVSLGGLDEGFFAYCEDIDLGFRHRLRGGEAVQIADAVVHHVGGSTSGRKSAVAVRLGWRNRWRTWLLNMPLALLVMGAPFHLCILGVSLMVGMVRGWGGPALAGLAEGVAETPRLLARRQARQRGRTASLATIAAVLEWGWSPLLTRRAKVIPRPPGVLPDR